MSAGRKLSTHIEEILRLAAHDEQFLGALLADRHGALLARGISPSAADLAVLKAIPEEQLRSMVDALRLAPPRLEPPEEISSMVFTGIRPDEPPVPGAERRRGWLSRLFRRR